MVRNLAVSIGGALTVELQQFCAALMGLRMGQRQLAVTRNACAVGSALADGRAVARGSPPQEAMMRRTFEAGIMQGVGQLGVSHLGVVFLAALFTSPPD